ncbi:MAG: thiamine phosphate synthase [Deltaproteobacteria bacterium]|nr:thiamine phosphate synthase [Deltaproteobacteria bacterium]
MAGKIPALYPIIDASLVKRSTPGALEMAARDVLAGLAGQPAGIIQLRAKETGSAEFLGLARILRRICRNATFIVNDRVDVALLAGADGVHLGQEDIPAQAARRLLGRGKIIGLSTHNIEEAREAEKLARKGLVDYISFGPVFRTGTKKDARPPVGIAGLKKARKIVTFPLVAIGGINRDNMPWAIGAGADSVAIISAILGAKDIRSETKTLVERLSGLSPHPVGAASRPSR